MIDLDEALREYAGQCRRDEPAPPDLDAALARVSAGPSRRRWPLLVAAAACVLLVASIAVVLGLRQPGRHATVAEPSSRPTAVHVPAVLLARLRGIARSTADENGDTGRVTAETVQTNGPWWIVQVHGTFACNWSSAAPALSSRSPQPTKSFSVLWVHIDVSVNTRRMDGFSCTDHSRNIRQYGPIVSLGTIAPAPYPDSLRQLAIDTARNNGDDNATAEAVLTTHDKAEVATEPDRDLTADRPVWVVEIHGHFTCHTCKIPPGASEPTGTTMIFFAETKAPYQVSTFEFRKRPVDLARLGKVVTLLP